MWLYAFLRTYPILSKCGALYRLFYFRYSTTFLEINEIISTLFFFFYNPY